MARGYPDYEGGKVGLYLKPEWAVYEGKDKHLSGTFNMAASGWNDVITYAVPAAKTLTLLEIDCSHLYVAAGDEVQFRILDDATVIIAMFFNLTYTKAMSVPIAIAGGHTLKLQCARAYGTVVTFNGTLGGYEL